MAIAMVTRPRPVPCRFPSLRLTHLIALVSWRHGRHRRASLVRRWPPCSIFGPWCEYNGSEVELRWTSHLYVGASRCEDIGWIFPASHCSEQDLPADSPRGHGLHNCLHLRVLHNAASPVPELGNTLGCDSPDNLLVPVDPSRA